MSRGKLFGDRSVGAVSVVEAPAARVFARRARLAWFVVTPAAAVVAVVALSDELSPVSAVLAGVLAGVVCGAAAAVLVRVWPVLRAVWWWAAELIAVSAVVAGAAVLRSAPSVVWVLFAALATAAAVVLVVSPARRWLLPRLAGFGRVVRAWVWCVVVRHRLRLCFAEFIRSGSRTNPGSLPLILWARPTPAGERVWVWLRPGLDLTDLEGKTDKLAVACWAGEVRVVRASTRFAALLRVDVTRRDPLIGVKASPLPQLVPAGRVVKASPVSEALPWGLDLPEVPEEIPEPTTRARR